MSAHISPSMKPLQSFHHSRPRVASFLFGLCVTHRPDSLEWGPFEAVGPDLVEGIRRIKSQAGPDLILCGSSTLTSPLLEHGLVDEVLLVVYPVLLGTGKRFFREGTPPRTFELLSTKTTRTGVFLNHYKVVGPLKIG
ncbi:dihydrofolate reductase family protein [Granulicella mallensis]|uniref:Dihydrofolate reductase n=1 Tax=Granulicella mallensis TaxID=940614 RepID=A0A7W8E9Z8_9BACT|nr:dihydrofolate reductase family protein [Granulicella mallensis]MBB5062870.1 dihydrofolate reductase [Granulicella mallensis]